MATFEDLTQPAVIKKLTDLIYRFHHFDIQQMALFDRQGNRAELSEIGTYLDLNFQVQGTIPDKADDEETDVTFQEVRRELTDEVIKVEQDFLRNFESGFRESMVLCHGDLHPGNILINDDTGEITLLDYEFTSYNFGVYDFGKIWYLRFFFESVGECDEDESEFNDDIKKLYFQDYLEAHCKYMGNDKCQDTDKEIELLDIQARISEIMYSGCYMMSLLALINQGMGEVDLMNVVLLLKEKYFENKGSLPSLRDQYLEKVSAMQAAKGWTVAGHLQARYSQWWPVPGIVSISDRHWKVKSLSQICVGILTITGSDNGLSPGRRQAIIWTHAGILFIGLLRANLVKF